MRYNKQINLKLFKYVNGAFVAQAIIDDYQEISFSHNLYEAGDFTITINYNIPNALKFERGMFIQFGNDAYMFGEILRISDAIGEDGKGSQIRTITGKDSRYIFKRRIIKNLNNEENWAMTAKGEICLRELIKAQCGSGAEAKRQLPITNTIPSSSNAIGKEYSVAESFSNLYDTLVTIATQSEIGWRIKFDGSLTLECFEGSDLSSQVQFSTDFDSLANGEFTDSAESFANTIYVGGKGTGSDRDIYEGESAIGGNSPSGFDRFEAWDNQSSMNVESEYEAEALSMLTQYGQTINVAGQGLAKCPYIFKEQYDIGDTITLAFSGKSAKAQILSVTEHWVWGEYGIEFSFGKPQNDLARQLQLILKQIQKASNKTTTTSSVRYYTIPTDTQMPKADVIYDTIGFVGDVGNGATFQLYLDDEKTGAKTYHVWFKQLAGSGKLTLTTGKAGASNLVMNSGTYVAIIYVDAQGNITMAGATTTDTIQAGNNQPVSSDGLANSNLNPVDTVTSGNTHSVTSGAVAEAIENVTSLPTDAVLHYSFDEVPDYPDGANTFKLLNGTTYNAGSAERISSVGDITTDAFTQDGKVHKSNVNGNANYKTDTSLSRGTGIYFALNTYQGKVIIIDFSAKTTNLDIKIYYKQDVADSRTIIYPLGTSVALGKHRIMLSVPAICAEYSLTFYSNNTVPNYTEWELQGYYVGDGSYATPVIDNANGQNNGINSGGIAIQGVSGKGAYFIAGKYSQCDFNLTPNFTISVWVNPSDNASRKSRNIVHKTNQLILRNGAGFGDYLQVYLYGDSSALLNGANFGSLLPPNVWTHIVMVRNGLEFSMYKNGEKTITITLADNTLRQNTEKFKVANEVNTGSQAVDDLLIFNRALSETEIKALYLNRGKTPKYYSWADWKLSQV